MSPQSGKRISIGKLRPLISKAKERFSLAGTNITVIYFYQANCSEIFELFQSN